jgi:hypothetical protein
MSAPGEVERPSRGPKGAAVRESREADVEDNDGQRRRKEVEA